MIMGSDDVFVTPIACGRNGTGLSGIVSWQCKLSGTCDPRVISNRILINCGDSTQRICSENRIKLSNISLILLSSLSPHNISGLPGLLLSLSTLVNIYSNTCAGKFCIGYCRRYNCRSSWHPRIFKSNGLVC
jgi:hypothetical protein